MRCCLSGEPFRLNSPHSRTGPVYSDQPPVIPDLAALHSDHYRQVLLYMILLDQGRLAAVDRWLPCTVTTIDRFYCS